MSYPAMLSGFGFVSLTDPEAAARAVEAMHGAEIDGRSIRVEKARRNNGYEKTPGVCKCTFPTYPSFYLPIYLPTYLLYCRFCVLVHA